MTGWRRPWVLFLLGTALWAAMFGGLALISGDPMWWVLAAAAPVWSAFVVWAIVRQNRRERAALPVDSDAELIALNRAVVKGELPADPRLLPLVPAALERRRRQNRFAVRLTPFLLLMAAIEVFAGVLGSARSFFAAALFIAVAVLQWVNQRVMNRRFARVERELVAVPASAAPSLTTEP